MLNTKIIVHPRLQHIALTSSRPDEMVAWYRTVLGMRLMHRNENPTGADHAHNPGVVAIWLTNDEIHHRMAILSLPGLSDDPQRSAHPRVQHFAFEYQTLDELLGSWVRLSDAGITPVLAADEGLQTAFYYLDPDRNSVELNVNNYGSNLTASEHLQHSPEFADRPLGRFVDPALLVQAREAGASPWDIHERAWRGEFAPAEPPNPLALY